MIAHKKGTEQNLSTDEITLLSCHNQHTSTKISMMHFLYGGFKFSITLTKMYPPDTCVTCLRHICSEQNCSPEGSGDYVALLQATGSLLAIT